MSLFVSTSYTSLTTCIGDLIGYANPGDSKCMCVLLTQLSYIPSARTLPGSTSVAGPTLQVAGSTSLSPTTPPSRKRRVTTMSLYPSTTPSASVATTSVPSSDEPPSSQAVTAVGKTPLPWRLSCCCFTDSCFLCLGNV
jgi:hypothetical protein